MLCKTVLISKEKGKSRRIQQCVESNRILGRSSPSARNSGMAAPSSILRFESFRRSRSFLELVPLAYRSFKTFQHSSGSVILAMYGITLSFTGSAIIVRALFFSTCKAFISAWAVGATVPAGGSTTRQISSLLSMLSSE